MLGDFLKVCRDKKIDGGEMEKIVERHMLQARSYFEEFVGLKKHRKALLKAIDNKMVSGFFKEAGLGDLVDKGFYTEDALREELNYLVRQNYLYYNPTLAEYKLQGKSMEIGLNRYVRELAP